MHALIDSTRKYKGMHMMIDSTQLKRLLGRKKVKNSHCIALNQLTLALNSITTDDNNRATNHRCHRPLPQELRTIHPVHQQWATPMDIMQRPNSTQANRKMHPLEYIWAQA